MAKAFNALERADSLWVSFHQKQQAALRDRAERLQELIARRIRNAGIYVG